MTFETMSLRKRLAFGYPFLNSGFVGVNGQNTRPKVSGSVRWGLYAVRGYLAHKKPPHLSALQ